MGEYVVRPVGHVRSPLRDPRGAPKQGDEGAPEAWIELDGRVAAGLGGLRPGIDVLVLTWLHLARRDVLTVHPRGDMSRPATGVFATRSPDRPNPIGLHRVRVLTVDPHAVQVAGLEAVDGTPVVDIKPVLGAADER